MTALARGARLLGSAWELHLLLLAAALVNLPDTQIDADILKGAATTLAVATFALPVIAWRRADAVRDWFGSAGGRLYTAFALVASVTLLRPQIAGLFGDTAAPLLPTSVDDRILVLALTHLAAVLGLSAARRTPHALGSAVLLATGISALVVLAQGLGLENRFSPPAPPFSGQKETVALMGNTMRAGALMALGFAACVGVLAVRLEQRARHAAVHRRHGDPGRAAADADAGLLGARGAAVLVVILTAAVLLTQARGARVGAALALAAVLFAVARGGGRVRGDDDAQAPRGALARAGGVLLLVLAGAALTVPVGGWAIVWARKLPESAPIFSGQDVTTSQRLGWWSSTVDLAADAPLTGVGLGRFRHEFAPYREAVDAARPSIAGTATEVWHPHNEFVNGLAEGGWPGALLLLAFALATVRRAWIVARQDGGAADVAALGIVAAGTGVALVSDAWVSPGSALPFFAAVGYVWAPRDAALHEHPDAAPSRAWPLLLSVLLVLSLVTLALPRWRSHTGIVDFTRAANRDGIGLDNFTLLVEAAALSPRDADLQRALQLTGQKLLRAAPASSRQVAPAVADAVLRLEALGALGPR